MLLVMSCSKSSDDNKAFAFTPLLNSYTGSTASVTPAEENKIVAHIPSKTGMHLITTPFDVTQVTLPASVELKKDCLTNLFIY